MRNYKYENVFCKGKCFSFTIKNCENVKQSKIKAVNWLLKKLNLPSSEFKNQLDYLSSNLENGQTKIIPQLNPQQMDLDLSSKDSKFNTTFEQLYSGLIQESDD